jgi:hypothetical protein
MPLEWLLLKIPWLLLISPTNLDSYCNRLVLYTLNWVAHLYSASFLDSKIFHFCKRRNSAAQSGDVDCWRRSTELSIDLNHGKLIFDCLVLLTPNSFN